MNDRSVTLRNFNDFFAAHLPRMQDFRQRELTRENKRQVIPKSQLIAEIEKFKLFKSVELGYDSTWSEVEQILDGQPRPITIPS